jgi:hypothetical protein
MAATRPLTHDFVLCSPQFLARGQILHKLAGEQGVKYKGSTSSMSPTLSQIYRLLSNFKAPDFDCFSPQFKNMVRARSHFFLRSTHGPPSCRVCRVVCVSCVSCQLG